MERVLILTVVVVAVLAVPISATIIMVPDDYSTIQQAINASSSGDTVLVEPETYVENIDFNGKNITVASMFLTTGDPSYVSSTIIDGDANGRVVTFSSGEADGAKIIGFTIQNGSAFYSGVGIGCIGSSPEIRNNIITANISTNNHGGGIYCTSNSKATIINNTITDNQAQLMGGGISCYSAGPTITNNTISANTAVEWDGGGIDCYDNANPVISYNVITGNSARYGGGIDCSEYSHATITNNTISGNAATIGGGILCWDSSPNIKNTIFWDDSAPDGPEIYVYGAASPIITYCDVEGSWPGTGNINDDPLFVGGAPLDYHLQSGSPCIDTGDPISPPDPDGTRADMGAFYFDQLAGVANDNSKPIGYSLGQNHPNPFSTTTIIQYSLSSESQVSIDIYDMLGRSVETLVSGKQPAGHHRIVWDAEGRSPGIYFYRIRAGGYIEARKALVFR